MGIYIKGMEMPKCCDDCNLESYCNLWICCRNEEERHSDCPLVELPPHGDLIDIDRLLLEVNNLIDSEKSILQIVSEAETLIRNAPVVIESEE